MKLRRLKKGFTLVELVVVIAIIAVLAGVSVAVYSSVTNKAKLSNDQTMIAQMNTTLAAGNILETFKYPGDSIVTLNENGFEGKYTPYSSGYHYGYHFETNTMYLVDNNEKIVFPSTTLETSSLWMLWQNTAVDKLDSANKYISLVNINTSGYYGSHFAEGDYTIDLAGHYICYTTGELSNVTVINGVLVSGATKGENQNVVEKEKITKEEISNGTEGNPTVIEGAVYDASSKTAMQGMSNVTFRDCYIYNANDEGSKPLNKTFESCTFIDSTSYIFNLQGSFEFTGTLTVRNCKFINCARVFNLPIGVRGQTGEGRIIVDGNEFYGVTGKDRSTCQLCQQKVNSSASESPFKFLDITFSNNTYHEIASTQAGLFTIHTNLLENSASLGISLDNLTFTSNHVKSGIPQEKWVVNDDGKADNAFVNNDGQLKVAIASKFAASVR